MRKGWAKQTLAIAALTSLWYVLLWYAAVMIRQSSSATAPDKGSQDADDEIAIRMKGPLEPDNSDLLNVIRKKYLTSPSILPYNFRYKKESRNPYLSGQLIESILKDLFGQKQNGFFVEAGALDGEYMSHTLSLEREQGWQGLLVEPDEHNFARLKERHRKAWISPTCLSTHDYPERVVLQRSMNPDEGKIRLNRGTGNILQRSELEEGDVLYKSLFSVGECFPLSSLLAALNISHVDFFVLDVEQVEREILNNFPFDKITVDVWAIEHVNKYEDTEFIKFMQQKGFYYFDALCYEVADYIFVRKSSPIFQILQVPNEHEDRTDICTFKIDEIKNEANVKTATLKFRDPHHFPEVAYKRVPSARPHDDFTLLLTGAEKLNLVQDNMTIVYG